MNPARLDCSDHRNLYQDYCTTRCTPVQYLRMLAGVGREVSLGIDGPVTLTSVLNALEAQYPMLRGTIRDQSRGSGDRSSGSSRAGGICHMIRPTRRCPTSWRRAQSR
jgi:hypothetical protein